MFTIQDIPGTFVNKETKKIRFADVGQLVMNGVIATKYSAKVYDGVLHVIVSQCPAGDGGKLLWHLSISHRQGWRHSGEEVFCRLPTWDELKLAKYKFIPPEIVMGILLPAKDQGYVDDHPTCLQMWEVPRELAD